MPPPYRIPTDLVRVEGRNADFVAAPPIVDGVSSPLLGVSPGLAGVEALSALGNSFTLSAVSSPGVFRDFGDFMTGGNRAHNAEVDQLITQEAIRLLEEARGESFGSERRAEVRRFVHDLLPSYKQNAGGQRNGNVDPADFPEILDHTLEHFGLRTRYDGMRVIESSEDMHWRIERLIEEEMTRPGNEALWSDPNVETLRATLRTRLRAEFSQILMNEWGSERLEDISDLLKSGIVADFESRAATLMTDVLSTAAVCTAPESNPAPAASINPWAEVSTQPVPSQVQAAFRGLDPRLADFFQNQLSAEGPVTTMADLLRVVSAIDANIPNEVLAAVAREGIPLTEGMNRAVFELVARAAEVRGAWSASDAVTRASLPGNFEAGIRRASGGGGERRVETAEDRERRERETRLREGELRARP